MSGTGKSTAVRELARRGYRAVDVDFSDLSAWDDGAGEWLWREDRMTELLAESDGGILHVAGCAWNQGRFYDRFEAVVPLSAPVDVLLERVGSRTTNDYGKDPDERARIVSDLEQFEPRLRTTSTHDLDATRAVVGVVDALVEIGRAVSPDIREAGDSHHERGPESSNHGACYGETPWLDSCSSRAASSRRSARGSSRRRSGAC
jgi:shikimate kinase